MPKKTEQAPPIRKSLLITGGVALTVAILGFIVMKFVLNGGGDVAEPLPSAPGNGTAVTTPVTPTPAPDQNVLHPGGRDPFSAPQSVGRSSGTYTLASGLKIAGHTKTFALVV